MSVTRSTQFRNMPFKCSVRSTKVYLERVKGGDIQLCDACRLKELRRSVLLPSIDLVLEQSKADSYRYVRH